MINSDNRTYCSLDAQRWEKPELDIFTTIDLDQRSHDVAVSLISQIGSCKHLVVKREAIKERANCHKGIAHKLPEDYEEEND